MADYVLCFDKMIQLEGGFVLHNVSDDRGGQTYAGISRNNWPGWPGWKRIDRGQLDSQLDAQVRAFYRLKFWDKIQGDEIGAQDAACHIFCLAVNVGLHPAVKMVQKIIGSKTDGIWGPKTFKALNRFIQSEKDEQIFILTLALHQVTRYKNICLRDSRRGRDSVKSNLKFLCGWINRVQRCLS